jgi:hypothetical protein
MGTAAQRSSGLELDDATFAALRAAIIVAREILVH